MMLSDEITIPEDEDDLFSRISVSQGEVFLFLMQGFLRENKDLWYHLQMVYSREEVTILNGDATYHFYYEARNRAPTDDIRAMVTPVCEGLAELLDHKVAISVVMPKE